MPYVQIKPECRWSGFKAGAIFFASPVPIKWGPDGKPCEFKDPYAVRSGAAEVITDAAAEKEQKAVKKKAAPAEAAAKDALDRARQTPAPPAAT